MRPTPRSKVRHVTYWTRAKYERMIVYWRAKGAVVLYGIHITRGAVRPIHGRRYP